MLKKNKTKEKEKKVDGLVEGKEEKKMFLGDIKRFFVQEMKKLYRRAAKLVHRQYISFRRLRSQLAHCGRH